MGVLGNIEKCINFAGVLFKVVKILKVHVVKIVPGLSKTHYCFQKTKVTETVLRDFHKLINTFLGSHFSPLKPNTIYYRNYKKFNEQKLLEDVKNAKFCFNSDDPNDNYELITDLFSEIVNKHAPLKKKFFRDNQVPFINKELRKVIYDRSRLRNRFCKTPTEENEINVSRFKGKVFKLFQQNCK